MHRKELWHSCADVWIFNSKREILLQKRSDNVNYPNLYDTSAAGHITSGDSPEDTALKEMHEELGIRAEKQDLKMIGIKKMIKTNPSTDTLDKEFNHIFFFRFDGDISCLKLNKDEIESIRLITLDKFESEIKDPEKYKRFVSHSKEYYFYIIEKIRETLQ